MSISDHLTDMSVKRDSQISRINCEPGPIRPNQTPKSQGAQIEDLHIGSQLIHGCIFGLKVFFYLAPLLTHLGYLKIVFHYTLSDHISGIFKDQISYTLARDPKCIET